MPSVDLEDVEILIWFLTPVPISVQILKILAFGGL